MAQLFWLLTFDHYAAPRDLARRAFGRLLGAMGESCFSASLLGNGSCRTTLSSDLWTRMRPLYSIKPSLRNRFMKKLTRERVVPIISARVSCGSWECIVLRFARLAKFRHQQENSRQPFFARVEELIDQIGLDAHAAVQQKL